MSSSLQADKSFKNRERNCSMILFFLKLFCQGIFLEEQNSDPLYLDEEEGKGRGREGFYG